MIANERNEGIYCEVMEIPRIYRETRARVEFSGRIIEESDEEKSLDGHELFNFGKGFMYFRYPGGEIPILSENDFANKLQKKGFEEVQIEKIMDLFWKTVATEASVSVAEIFENVN